MAPAPVPVPVQVQQQATTVTFDIELPYSIPSDGKARQVDIKRHQLPANYRHLAVPKFTSDVFLKASVTNWEQYTYSLAKSSSSLKGLTWGLLIWMFPPPTIRWISALAGIRTLS